MIRGCALSVKNLYRINCTYVDRTALICAENNINAIRFPFLGNGSFFMIAVGRRCNFIFLMIYKFTKRLQSGYVRK